MRSAPDGRGHRRQQRGLQQTDLLQQLAALAVQAARAQRAHQIGAAEHDRQSGQRSQGELQRARYDLDDVAHRPGDRGGRRVGCELARLPLRPGCVTGPAAGRAGTAVVGALRAGR